MTVGMVAGSVTVASDETPTGTDCALAMYTADVASMTAAGLLPTLPTLGSTAAPYSAGRPVAQADIDATKKARLALLRESARRATAFAAGFVPYYQANARAKVFGDASSDGLLRDPSGINCLHPGADAFIPLI